MIHWKGIRLTSVCLLLWFSTVGVGWAQPTQITIQVDNRANYLAWIEAVVEQFEEEHPEIDVEIWVPSGNLLEAIMVSIASGSPPDIGLHDPYVIIDLARQGLLEDLTPYMERSPDHFSAWLPPATQMTQYNGGLYALPRDLQVYGVYYNVDQYNASGIGAPDENWTWADYHDHSRRLQRTDDQGRRTQFGSILPEWRNWVIPIWAHGGDFVDSWTNPTRFTGRSENTIQGLEFMKGLVDSNAVMDRDARRQWNQNTAFMEQKTGLYMQNTIAIQSLREIQEFTWDVAPMPVGPAGRVTVMNALVWFLMSSSQSKDEAWTLLQYITSPKALSMMVEMVGVVPPNRDVLLNEWIPSVDMPHSRQNVLIGIETARPTIGALAKTVYDLIYQEALAIMWGDKALSAGIENMEQLVETALTELNR